MDMIQYVEAAGTGSTQKIPWPLVQGLSEKLSYGGRIDNDQDFNRLECLIREFIDEKIMTSRWQPMFLNITVPNSNHVEVSNVCHVGVQYFIQRIFPFNRIM